MPGLNPRSPLPTALTLHGKSHLLEIAFSNGKLFKLSFELLRVYSPSAEVRGHGPGQEVLQTGKRDVTIHTLAQVGNYAVQPQFSDGHNTGIYSWDYLYWLGENESALWQKYIDELAAAGASRGSAPLAANVKISEATRGGCG